MPRKPNTPKKLASDRPIAKAKKSTRKSTIVEKPKKASSLTGKTKVSATLGLLMARMELKRDEPSLSPKLGITFEARKPDAERRSHGGRPESTVPIIVRVRQGTQIEGLCGRGSIRTARVSLDRVRELASLEAVRRISAPRQLRPLMDIALPLANVLAYRNAPGTSATGNGTIIGIVDSGIDATHPAFQGRVLKIWDQVIEGPGPGTGFTTGGQVLVSGQHNLSVDSNGHGTHVAGIAAGSGSPFGGVAPDADLLVVKTDFYNSSVLEGVRWIFEEAESLGRPAVVNLSLGGHGDGHDGNDDLSIGISELCGPGRLVVAAAGNERGDGIHAMQSLAEARTASFPLTVEPRSSGEPLEWFWLNGWYSGSGTCDIRLISPAGTKTPWQGLMGGSTPARRHLSGADTVTLSTPDSFGGTGDHQFGVEVVGGDGRVQGGRWTLEVRRTRGKPGTVHVWLLHDPNASRRTLRFDGSVATDSHLIGSPGASSEAITVAAYTSRNTWTDLSGRQRQVGMIQNDISDFSSPGPLRNGAPKPDVTAPGAMIASCESSAARFNPSNRIATGYVLEAGTSMASPFVAGVMALLLEKRPLLTPDEAKDFLKSHSHIPAAATGVHDPGWGYGLLRL